MTAPDRRHLLLRHREGDPDAFAELVCAYRVSVYSYLGRCGVRYADCDDLFQEIFMQLHRAAHSYCAELPLHPWLFTIVANTVRRHLRRRRLREVLFADCDGHAEAVVEPQEERRSAARERLAWLERAISQLPLERREVLLLTSVEKLSQREVARILGLSVQAVRVRLRRARLALTKQLAGLDECKGST